jgi:energy-coupling factor transport system substrate-specific component
VSWQLAVFTILGLVIAAGFLWYERSRPSSRTVALVAALAALAVAGRLILAPVPNVVATTDVALVTGFALGGAPGFAVGALAAPVSNLWLGQGPWTPWQMAGWGLCGLLGAGLAWLTNRRAGRLTLALACASAGLAYGALLDLSVMVTFGGEQSLDRYLALSARALPFNIAHAVGNFAIALAAGPALVRMISRFRQRSEFTWRPATAIPLLLVICGLAIAASPPPPAHAAGPADARAYLERQQNPDGGYGATPSASSNLDMTAWAMLGMEASGRNPLDLRRNGRSPVDFLRAHPATSTADLEKVILALEGAGLNSRSFEGRDLVGALRSKRNSNGSWGGFVDLTAFGVFAMKAAGAPASELRRSTAWLRSAQNNDGGWGFEPGSFSTPDSTGSALQALATTGAGTAGRRAVSYLRRAQSSDGSFGANSQGTAWAVQGLVAVEANPAAFAAGGNTAFDFLAARQMRDGHYRYSASSDQTPIWVTSQALMAFEREAFPVEPVPRTSQPGGLPPPVAPTGSNGASGGAVGSTKRGAGEGPKGSNAAKETSRKQGKKKRANGSTAGDEEAAGAALASAEVPAGAEAGEGAGGDATPYLLGGLAALALALGGGFLWYRRRLP